MATSRIIRIPNRFYCRLSFSHYSSCWSFPNHHHHHHHHQTVTKRIALQQQTSTSALLYRNMTSTPTTTEETITPPPPMAESVKGNDKPDNTEGASISSDKKRPHKEEDKRDSKKTKKEAAKNRAFKGFNTKVDERDKPPHEGSFANPSLREQFGIELSTMTNNNEDSTTNKKSKKKVALLLGFLGTNYGGFQVNANQRSLQAVIELACYEAGMLNLLNFGYPFKYGWSTSARTDKGVHACAQVCSLKLEVLESDLEETMEGVRQRLEAQLPSDIRVLDVARTTRSFCAKTQRDRARYQYMIPSFLLHTDARSVLTEQGIPLEGRKEIAKEPLSKEEIQKLQPILKAYRSTDEQRELLKAALKKYEGTHPFHNFTKGLKPGQASANRYIESFRVQDPVIIDGVEWIPTQVLGQSFLLNQIRKMISMAVDVARGVASLEAMDKALTKMTTLRVSLAPAQGLFLEMSYYGGYNKRKAQNKELPDLDWTVEGPATDRWEAFRNTIRKHIVEEEALQGNFLQYFYQQECIFKYKLSYDEPEKGGEDETTYKDAEK